MSPIENAGSASRAASNSSTEITQSVVINPGASLVLNVIVAGTSSVGAEVSNILRYTVTLFPSVVVCPHSLVALINTLTNPSEGDAGLQSGENVSGLSTIESTAASVLQPVTVSTPASSIALMISSSFSSQSSPSISMNRRLIPVSPILGSPGVVNAMLGPLLSIMTIVTSVIVLSLPQRSIAEIDTVAVRVPSVAHVGSNAPSTKSPVTTISIVPTLFTQLSARAIAPLPLILFTIEILSISQSSFKLKSSDPPAISNVGFSLSSTSIVIISVSILPHSSSANTYMVMPSAQASMFVNTGAIGSLTVE